MIHREGKASLILVGTKFLVLNLALYFLWPELILLRWIIGTLSLIGFLFILQFFRNPKRVFNLDENSVLCPADGKVVVIEETEETEYLKEKRIQVSVFMSPLNVHVNRNPVDGIISYFRYHPGKYLVAWHPKSSTENERTTVVYKLKNETEILIRQIAGAAARRIKWYVKTEDPVRQGEEFGFIKFGSRVDLYLPLDYKINVKIGDVVRGGITSIATLK
jgi:phosphatidylserine decarboxylase